MMVLMITTNLRVFFFFDLLTVAVNKFIVKPGLASPLQHFLPERGVILPACQVPHFCTSATGTTSLSGANA